MSQNKISPITILTDIPEIDKPTNEFEDLANIIAGIIEGSTPEFTIGIYGKWGTGKTTLMQSIQKKFVTKEEERQYKKSKVYSILKKYSGRMDSLFVSDSQSNDTNYQLVEKYPTVWFNAWRFEREKAKATIPLMIMIIERLLLELDNKKKTRFLAKIGQEIVSFLNGCEYHLQVTIPGITFDVTRLGNDDSNDNPSKEDGYTNSYHSERS